MLIPQSKRLEQLRRTADSIIDLADDVDPERDHIRGDPDGAVTLVEYADFECPYCGRAEPTIRELLDMHHGGGLRYVFRHLPLQDVHPHAQLAAEASEAAAAQGAFWQMHDTLMAHQGELDLDDVHRYAEELELDADRLEDEVRRRVYSAAVSEDVSSADASGVSGTPTFFINGRRHQGVYDIDALTKAIGRAKVAGRRGSEGARREEGGEGRGEAARKGRRRLIGTRRSEAEPADREAEAVGAGDSSRASRQVSRRPPSGSISFSRSVPTPSAKVRIGTSAKIGLSSWARCRL